MKSRIYIPIIFLLCLVLVACKESRTSQPQTMEKVRLQLKWQHQAQFAGFYVAQERGYYEQENIQVSFIEGGKGIDPAQQLISGKADFAVMGPEDLLIKRSHGEPLAAVAAIYQHSAVVFAARQDSGIVRPRDFLGKTVAVGGDESGIRDLQVLFNALMNKLQVDISQIDIVAYDPTYKAFFKGDVDVTPVYYTGGLIKIRDQGLNPNLIWPSDYGIHFFSDILAATDAMIQESPDMVDRFVRASLKGWKDIYANFDQTVTVVLKYARIKDPALQKVMLESMLPLIHTGRKKIGIMNPQIWQNMYKTLREQGLIKNTFDVHHAYTLKFVDKTGGDRTG